MEGMENVVLYQDYDRGTGQYLSPTGDYVVKYSSSSESMVRRSSTNVLKRNEEPMETKNEFSGTTYKQRKPRLCNGDPNVQKLSREERRRRRRCTEKYRHAHATRERARIEAFNHGFGELRKLLPVLPPDKKLSKIEILRLAICYIAYLSHVLGS